MFLQLLRELQFDVRNSVTISRREYTARSVFFQDSRNYGTSNVSGHHSKVSTFDARTAGWWMEAYQLFRQDLSMRKWYL